MAAVHKNMGGAVEHDLVELEERFKAIIAMLDQFDAARDVGVRTSFKMLRELDRTKELADKAKAEAGSGVSNAPCPGKGGGVIDARRILALAFQRSPWPVGRSPILVPESRAHSPLQAAEAYELEISLNKTCTYNSSLDAIIFDDPVGLAMQYVESAEVSTRPNARHVTRGVLDVARD